MVLARAQGIDLDGTSWPCPVGGAGDSQTYVARVIDLFSRRLLGYAMGTRHDAEPVVASLNMAAATRGGDVRGVIMHTDRGRQRVLLPEVQAGLPQAGRHPVHGQSWILFR
ncbi:DDE-type integrase/transposase/recombinase [Streptomyces sp. NPDC055966]|uniref:DDE-type integrase/transposase/recombinase n=1 Tax=Streptomyces sp. NPDC055966 TaxID=3345669 RepID=UPI0035DAF702